MKMKLKKPFRAHKTMFRKNLRPAVSRVNSWRKR